ncbi:MAG: hypothetical protein E7640_03805 [Ruminococcaceae bacterium]|nr:hypothetical protein [Oscillospiraceae bacterium]
MKGEGMLSFIKDKISRIDPIIFICTSLLSLISIAVLIGARESEFGGTRTIIMQVAMTLAGLIIMIMLANVDFANVPSWFFVFAYAISAVFLVLLLFVGENAGENVNWIKIPLVNISIQPSEFVRASFILTFAKHLSVVKDEINRPKNVLLLVLHAGGILGLLLLTGDLGMVLVYLGIMIVMLFCAGFSIWYFLAGIGAAVVAFPFLWDYLADYQKKRILVGFNPDMDPLDKGLQQIQSRSAIAGGGFLGRGIEGAGSFENMYGCVTDFFFASYAEMFGFVGSLLLVGILTVLVIRLFLLAAQNRDPFSALLLAGIGGMVIVQTVENIGMCLCLLPVVGITLPFLSAGGSSVLSIYMIIGIAHAASGSRKKGSIRKIKTI